MRRATFSENVDPVEDLRHISGYLLIYCMYISPLVEILLFFLSP
jgi:hypothetical protein